MSDDEPINCKLEIGVQYMDKPWTLKSVVNGEKP